MRVAKVRSSRGGFVNVDIIGNTGGTITLSATSGSFNNFIMSDGTTTQTIDDGNTMLFQAGSGLTATVTATDTITYDLDITGTTIENSPTTGTTKLLIYDVTSGTHRNIDCNYSHYPPRNKRCRSCIFCTNCW